MGNLKADILVKQAKVLFTLVFLFLPSECLHQLLQLVGSRDGKCQQDASAR